mmetsp:Transcript_15484/g.33547  ORF Transcript_15484/g.33547 Transcript_15484/m.33547 type:complete len:80 (-) Transcript_15484:700-939(-)
MSRSSRSSFNNSMSMSVSSFESMDAAVTWPPECSPLREAIAYILLDSRLKGIRCTADQIVTPLNYIGGFVGGGGSFICE